MFHRLSLSPPLPPHTQTVAELTTSMEKMCAQLTALTGAVQHIGVPAPPPGPAPSPARNIRASPRHRFLVPDNVAHPGGLYDTPADAAEAFVKDWFKLRLGKVSPGLDGRWVATMYDTRWTELQPGKGRKSRYNKRRYAMKIMELFYAVATSDELAAVTAAAPQDNDLFPAHLKRQTDTIAAVVARADAVFLPYKEKKPNPRPAGRRSTITALTERWSSVGYSQDPLPAGVNDVPITTWEEMRAAMAAAGEGGAAEPAGAVAAGGTKGAKRRRTSASAAGTGT